MSNTPAMPRPNAHLTPKEALFVTEYLVDKNGAGAAARAGYSERSAKETAYKLLQRPHIKAAIAKALKEQQRRTLISADQVLLDINQLADKAAKAGEFHAAIRGKELIGKHYKLFTEKHEHGGIGGGPVQMVVSSTDEAL